MKKERACCKTFSLLPRPFCRRSLHWCGPFPQKFPRKKQLRRFASSDLPHVTPGMRREHGREVPILEPRAPFQQQSVPLPRQAPIVGPTASLYSVLTCDLRQGLHPTQCLDSRCPLGRKANAVKVGSSPLVPDPLKKGQKAPLQQTQILLGK